MDNKLPAISVIIPLYNTEKYIGECLDSLLAQTFQNFEVIVVDDCSTDSSCAIVENFIPKFEGRLRLSHMKKNSGNAALPRNKGVAFSQGEYVYIMDSDDILAKNALEELITFAKRYDADVVYCERHFETDPDGSNVRLVRYQKGDFMEQPTFASGDLISRVNYLLENDIWGPPWNELVRRDVLIENEIMFPEVRPGDDHLWLMHLFFTAEKFLHIPSALYFWRKTKTSITRGKTPQKNATLWLGGAVTGLKYLNEVLGKIAFFEENFKYRYMILDYFLNRMFYLTFYRSLELLPCEIYAAIKDEFGKNLGRHDVLVAALCAALNSQQKKFLLNQQKFDQLSAQAQERIAQLERLARENQAYIAELENFIAASAKFK